MPSYIPILENCVADEWEPIGIPTSTLRVLTPPPPPSIHDKGAPKPFVDI